MVAAMHRRRKGTSLMAIDLTSTGVDFVSGRGKNKAVTLSMTFKQLETWAKRQRIDVPRLMNRSFGRACSGLKKKFYQVMQNAGGVNGVPKFKDFEDFTKELREAGKRSGVPMGGVLADKSRIVAFKRNGWQIIGWPDALAAWAVKFQDGGDSAAAAQFADPSWRSYVHRTTRIHDIPRAYVRNPRRVIPEPFGDYVKANLEEWAKGAFYRELARQFQKAGAA